MTRLWTLGDAVAVQTPRYGVRVATGQVREAISTDSELLSNRIGSLILTTSGRYPHQRCRLL